MRILVGMSGGVDSAVAVYLLKGQGYEPVGVNLVLNGDESASERAAECAAALGIEFHTVNFSDEFSKLVKAPFAESYLNGETPNPCVICNREIKFGLMYDLLKGYGCEKLATGHYAKSEYSKKYKRFVLKKAVDMGKDQSYFLWELDGAKLENTIFPLGDITKAQIREIAEREQLPCAKSPDSQDVCFIPTGDCAEFISSFTGRAPVPGNFIDESGKVLGEHKGITAYTVGQRKGLGVSAECPLYVLKKDSGTNTVVLGKNESLYYDTVNLRHVKMIAGNNEARVEAKIRYSVNSYPATVYIDGACGVLKFDAPQRAPSPGQSAVFYDGDIILGGGIITDI